MKRLICLVLSILLVLGAVPSVMAEEDAAAEIAALRAQWYTMLCGTEDNSQQPALQSYLEQTANTALARQKEMQKESDVLFPQHTDYKKGESVTDCFSRLKQMALGYATPGTSTYKSPGLLDDITYGLDFLYDHGFNEHLIEFDSWWQWEIGSPEIVADILIMLYDDIHPTTFQKMITAMDFFCPAPDYNNNPREKSAYMFDGANRAWRCKIVILSGILQNDPERIQLGVDLLEPAFRVVTSGEGYYDDGTFIAHGRLSYSGGYGVTNLEKIALLSQLLAGSKYDMLPKDKALLINHIYKTYEPAIYNGSFMDMFRGRELSRYNSQDHDAGHKAIRAILKIGFAAEEPDRSRILGMLKYQIQQDTVRDIYDGATINDLPLLDELLGNDEIAATPPQPAHIRYPQGDRVIHRGDGYAFGIAMYSTRIYNYEGKDIDENRKGWYLGTGMTYLYNAQDQSQYTDYYPTIDALRLPGITASERQPMKVTMGINEGGPSPCAWVGGTDMDGLYGVTGMQFDDNMQLPNLDPNLYLRANKSWFMFDKEIIALGSGVTGNDQQAGTETTYENRKVTADNIVTVDGEQKPAAFEETVENAKWAHIEGTGGYVFSGNDTVNIKREVRTGKWEDVNLMYNDGRDLSEEYVTIWKDHGLAPENDTYQYTILPNATAEETKAYSENPTAEVLQNDQTAAAVRENRLGITAVNFWKDEPASVGGISVDSACSVMVKEDDKSITVSLSDPTQLNTGIINVEIDGQAAGLISTTGDIGVVSLDDGKIKLQFNVIGKNGNTMTIKLSKEETALELPAAFPEDTGVKAVNIVENGGFETGKIAPWYVSTASEVTAEDAHTGNYCLKWTTTGGYNSQRQVIPPLQKNTEYQLSFWGKFSDTNFLVKADTDDDPAVLLGQWSVPPDVVKNEWQRFSFNFTTGENENVRFFLSERAGAKGAVHYIDDVVLELADGAGTLNAEPSEDGLGIIGTGDNLFANPSFMAGNGEPWNLPSTAKIGKEDNKTCLEWYAGSGALTQQLSPILAKSVYSVSFDAKLTDPNLMVRVYTDDGTMTKVGEYVAEQTQYKQDEWTSYAFTFPTNDLTKFKVYFYNNCNASKPQYIRNIALRLVSTETPKEEVELPEVKKAPAEVELENQVYDEYNPEEYYNMYLNPGFETGDINPWYASPNSQVVSNDKHSGSYSLKWTISGGTASQRQPLPTMKPNTDYVYTFWAKFNNNNFSIAVTETDDNNRLYVWRVPEDYKKGQWAQYGFKFNTYDYSNIAIWLSEVRSDPGDEHYFDDFMLFNPAEKLVEFVPEPKKQVRLTLGSGDFTVDGAAFTGAPMQMINGSNYIPYDAVIQAMGGEAELAADGTAVLRYNGKEAEFAEPMMADGIPYIPVRALVDAFVLKVYWLPDSQTAVITYDE